jgi:hypothetical protein
MMRSLALGPRRSSLAGDAARWDCRLLASSRLPLACAALVLCTACSPISVAARTRAAERAHQRARSAQAELHAPYEYVLASLYLEKAREESAEANYAGALDLLNRSEQSARRARVLAEARTPGAAR